MNSDDTAEDAVVYDVVVNDEEQYSIWAAHRPGAPGWRPAGKRGSKRECLEYIETVWTDMRPRTLREHMAAEDARRRAEIG